MEVCRKMGICEATFYSWKKKYRALGIFRSPRASSAENGDSSAEADGGGFEPGQTKAADVLQKNSKTGAA